MSAGQGVDELDAYAALWTRPEGERWDRDGRPLELDEWITLVADADYRLLVVTRFGPEWTGGGWVTVRTEWAGVDLRPLPDLTRRPLIFATDVIGGPLDGRRWFAARQPTAHFMHDHAIGEVCSRFPGAR